MNEAHPTVQVMEKRLMHLSSFAPAHIPWDETDAETNIEKVEYLDERQEKLLMRWSRMVGVYNHMCQVQDIDDRCLRPAFPPWMEAYHRVRSELLDLVCEEQNY